MVGVQGVGFVVVLRGVPGIEGWEVAEEGDWDGPLWVGGVVSGLFGGRWGRSIMGTYVRAGDVAEGTEEVGVDEEVVNC